MNGFTMGSFIPEMEKIISELERGTLIMRFDPRKRPEWKTLMIRRETRQILWARTATRTFQGSIEMREVKEIRLGKYSKNFDKWPEESKKHDTMRCFVIFYGSEFKLKVFSVAALSEKECEQWLRGLENLILDTVHSPFPLQVERWLRKEFYNMEPARDMVTMKDIKSFLPRVNCKISTSKLREYFQEVDLRKRNEITFDEFVTFYQKIMFDETIFREACAAFCDPDGIVTAKGLTQFLLKAQGEKNINEKQVARHMRDYLQDNQRNVPEPYFTANEFMDFLYSRQNDIWDQRYDEVHQDMTRPLSHYWISSSHNTYLTGDQISSESSVEAYVRCLRLGCRCIELDCWDGSDGSPIIYHGLTFTSRLKFIDVITTIKEQAFISSPYPVILSIEDRCSLQQQREMARIMQEVFGDLLLTQPVDKNETKLPSPHQLKNKIILKHKKLPEGKEEDAVLVANEDDSVFSTGDMDLRNSVKNGVLYLQDVNEKKWNPHFFVLTRNKLYYTECVNAKNDQDGEEEADSESETTTASSVCRHREGIPNNELHYGEEWFHGKLPGGRDEAKELLREYSHLGDGTFLVRESETFVGDYSLSFWRQDRVNHCRIKSRQENGKTKYYLIDSVCFDSLYSLIAHYRIHPLRSQEFLIILKDPVPQPKKHEGKDWYHATASRGQAEDLLKKVPYDGAFLVRPSDKEQNTYVISFRAEKNIKHCRIRVDGRLYTVGSTQFESLVELISYYERHPLYKKIKLLYPVNESIVQRNFPTALILTIFYQTTRAYVTGLPTSTIPNSQIPQYRFHYYVKDEKTGDYKAQEEHRTGDSVTGSYMVGEPNGDLRVVTYIADVTHGFKADVNVQPGASPVKTLGANVPKDGIAGFNSYRTGISPPPRTRKPARGFNPIVVNPKSISLTTQTESTPYLTAATHPYPYYKDTQNTSAFATTPATKKSVQVDLTFNDEAVIEKRAEVTVVQQKKTEPPSTEMNPSPSHVAQNGIYQLGAMDIPSSVMDILSQNKGKDVHAKLTDVSAGSTVTAVTVTQPSTQIEENGSSKVDLIQQNENAPLNDSTSIVKKISLPQRPMRLIGLSPIYMEISQLQTITENLTSVPQMHFDSFPNIQYATPAPFHSGPLPNGPAGPFRNLPRSVSESANPEYSIINSMPVFSSVPISAPIVSQSITETKADNKTPSPTLPLCNDCLIPASYMSYPVVRMPFPATQTSNQQQQQQKPNCPPSNAPVWAPYTPSLAYILMPTSVLKNNKLNDTRSITTSIWRK